MNLQAREIVVDMVRRYGTQVLDDQQKGENLLRDLLAGHRREMSALIAAFREGVPARLAASANDSTAALAIASMSRMLEDHLALSAEAAEWSVETWALALRIPGFLGDHKETAHLGPRLDPAVASNSLVTDGQVGAVQSDSSDYIIFKVKRSDLLAGELRAKRRVKILAIAVLVALIALMLMLLASKKQETSNGRSAIPSAVVADAETTAADLKLSPNGMASIPWPQQSQRVPWARK